MTTAVASSEKRSVDLTFEFSGNQIDGARDHQEDAFLTAYLDDDSGDSRTSMLAVMADGMGGHAAGNIASNLVVSTFHKHVTGQFGKESLPTILRAALYKANDSLRASIQETPALDGMGCTMVTAAFTDGKVWWVSVGDSHLYLIREREIVKKNEDHSYGGYLDRMKDQGMDVEAESGLSRNMLMSAMTGEEINEVDCPEEPLELMPGDRVIVASDGLDTLGANSILQYSSWSKSPKECVEALLKAVEEAEKPRQDNTTIIVVDVFDRGAQRAAASTPAADAKPAVVEEVPTLELDSIESVAELPGSDLQAPVADFAFGDDFEEPEGGGRKGLIMAVAAIVLVLAGGGAAWYWYGTRGEGSAPTVAPAPSPPPPVAVPEPQPEPEPAAEPESLTDLLEDLESEPAQPGAAEPAEAAGGKEFRDQLRSGGEGPLMVAVPAGTFEMGSSGLSVATDERPRRAVQVKAFAISRYEITFAQYEAFAKSTGRRSLPDNRGMDKETHPVIFVNWDDAYNYTRWLSDQTGERYRLPSEAQWEYAAAAGSTSTYWWGYEVGRGNAHCFGCDTGLDLRKPTQVGRFKPNPFGIHDMLGNVAEWVHDCYHRSYQGAPTDGGVWEGGDCSYRVVRGGAYSNPPPSIRTRKRSKLRSTEVYDSVGIRVVRELKP